ncbi:hypothetical protein D5086_033194 [Populus alba]|uniref:Uncharacterized protein n=1 Tax=Populus alba TaxID=43335 RepID=A0ACC4AG46_POPAL
MLFSSSKKTRRVTVCRLRRLEDIRDTRSTPAALYHCRGFCKNSCVMQVNCVKDGAYVRFWGLSYTLVYLETRQEASCPNEVFPDHKFQVISSRRPVRHELQNLKFSVGQRKSMATNAKNETTIRITAAL